MSKAVVIQRLEKRQLKNNIPDFRVGDTVKVHTRIIEGEKERIQVFTGTVIARSGTGLSETFSIHRVAYGEGMERVFLLHSPRIAKIEVTRQGQVRRAKLYYLRGTQGKAAKVKASIVQRRGVVQNKEKPKEAVEQKDKEETVLADEGAVVEEAKEAEVKTEEAASGSNEGTESSSN